MGTRQKVQHVIVPFKGQASGFNPEALEPGKAREAYNFYLQNGMMKKIPGSSLYIHSAYGSSPIVWMDWFLRRAMWQLGPYLLIETAEGSQVEELLASDFDTDKIFSDKWREKIYLANGKQLRFYDGSVTDNLGLLPPGGGLVPRVLFSATESAGPGFTAATVYRYTITFYDTETNTESLPIGSLPDELGLFNTAEFDADDNPLGWLTQSVTAPAGGAAYFEIGFDAQFRGWLQSVAPARADVVRIYRAKETAGIPGDYRLLTGFPLTNGVFIVPFTGLPSVEGNSYLMTNLFTVLDVTYSDASLFQVLLTEDLAPPPTRAAAIGAGAGTEAVGPKFIRFWRDSLFLFGSTFPTYTVTDSLSGITDKNFASGSILYGSDTSLPEYYPFNWEIGAGDEQEPTGLAVVGDVLCVFKERSIYTLVGTSLNNFVPKIQDEARGCIAPGSIQETPFGAIFLSAAGVARFRGSGQSEVLSNDILDEIQNINRSALGAVTSSYDPDQEIYTIFIPAGTATLATRFLQLSLKDAGWTVGERNRQIGSAVIIPKQNGPQTSLLGTAAGGLLLNISSREVVSDYDGERLTAFWRSGDFDFGKPEENKRLTYLYVKARCSINWFIDIGVYCNDGQSYVYEAEDLNSESDISVYASSQTDPDGAIYDTSRYMGAQTEKLLKIPINGIGRDFFIEITEKSNNTERNSFDLISVSIEAVLLTR